MDNAKAEEILDVLRSYYVGKASNGVNDFPQETVAGYSMTDIANACMHGAKALKEKSLAS